MNDIPLHSSRNGSHLKKIKSCNNLVQDIHFKKWTKKLQEIRIKLKIQRSLDLKTLLKRLLNLEHKTHLKTRS